MAIHDFMQQLAGQMIAKRPIVDTSLASGMRPRPSVSPDYPAGTPGSGVVSPVVESPPIVPPAVGDTPILNQGVDGPYTPAVMSSTMGDRDPLRNSARKTYRSGVGDLRNQLQAGTIDRDAFKQGRSDLRDVFKQSRNVNRPNPGNMFGGRRLGGGISGFQGMIPNTGTPRPANAFAIPRRMPTQ